MCIRDREYNDNINVLTNESNPFFNVSDKKKTIVISNTATTAQLSYLKNMDHENSMLAHSKYTKEDKVNILKNVKSKFAAISNDNITLRSGPILQASVNITSERLITELTNPENTLQRLGRLNRFGDGIVGEFIIGTPNKALLGPNSTGFSPVLSLLGRNNERESVIKWFSFLTSRLSNVFQLSDIYGLYKEFYESPEVKKILSKELEAKLKNSYKNICKNIPDPIVMPKVSSSKKKLAKLSLRGESFFVKIANYAVENGSIGLSDSYSDNITLSKEDILLYEEDYQFVHETMKQFEIINPKADKKTKDMVSRLKKAKTDKKAKVYMGLAKSADMPIVMSFSSGHLSKLNKSGNKDNSIVYLKSKKQNIGYIKLDKLDMLNN